MIICSCDHNTDIHSQWACTLQCLHGAANASTLSHDRGCYMAAAGPCCLPRWKHAQLPSGSLPPRWLHTSLPFTIKPLSCPLHRVPSSAHIDLLPCSGCLYVAPSCTPCGAPAEPKALSCSLEPCPRAGLMQRSHVLCAPISAASAHHAAFQLTRSMPKFVVYLAFRQQITADLLTSW